MSGLANRLAVAAWSEMKDSPYSNWSYDQLRPQAKARADRTVAAVLRELAEAIADDHEPGPFWVERTDDGALTAGLVRQVERIEHLAEVIEKGEQT